MQWLWNVLAFLAGAFVADRLFGGWAFDRGFKRGLRRPRRSWWYFWGPAVRGDAQTSSDRISDRTGR